MTIQQILIEGERIYSEKRAELERDHLGDYIVIDTNSGEYIVNQDKLLAFEEAKRKFGEKIFYIVRIGDVSNNTLSYRKHGYSWIL